MTTISSVAATTGSASPPRLTSVIPTPPAALTRGLNRAAHEFGPSLPAPSAWPCCSRPRGRLPLTRGLNRAAHDSQPPTAPVSRRRPHAVEVSIEPLTIHSSRPEARSVHWRHSCCAHAMVLALLAEAGGPAGPQEPPALLRACHGTCVAGPVRSAGPIGAGSRL
jgi:hypothetical protein